MVPGRETIIHEYLVKNYTKYYKIAYTYVLNEEDALDIVQEGAYKAIYKSDTLKNIEYADTWICKIMMNEALQLLRRKKKEAIPSDNLPDIGCEEDFNKEEVDLISVMKCLTPEERNIIVLRFFEEQKLEEIADILKININTVKSRLYRALEKLRKQLLIGGLVDETA